MKNTIETNEVANCPAWCTIDHTPLESDFHMSGDEVVAGWNPRATSGDSYALVGRVLDQGESQVTLSVFMEETLTESDLVTAADRFESLARELRKRANMETVRRG